MKAIINTRITKGLMLLTASGFLLMLVPSQSFAQPGPVFTHKSSKNASPGFYSFHKHKQVQQEVNRNNETGQPNEMKANAKPNKVNM